MQFRRHSLIHQLALAALLLACAAAHAEEPALRETSLLGGRVKMLLPRDFEPMNEALILIKYPSADRPDLVYTDKTAGANVALRHTPYQAPPEQMAGAHAQISADMRSRMPSAEWFRDEIRTINGRPFLLFEMRTPAINTRVRNIMVFTSLDNRLLVISFNVARELEGQWLAAGNRIIESIVLE